MTIGRMFITWERLVEVIKRTNFDNLLPMRYLSLIIIQPPPLLLT